MNNELLPEQSILELARFFYTGESHNRDEKIDKDALVKNIIKIIKLVIITISVAFFLACFWFRFNTYYIKEEHQTAFMSHMGLEEEDSRMTKLIRVSYFALTTLSTVGYGDFSPDGPESKPNISLAFGALILITGVTFFSTLTSSFIEII